jgi:hypothetical protein
MAMSPIRIMINSWKSWSDCNHILWTVKDLSSVFRNEHVLYVCIILDRLDLAIMLHNESAASITVLLFNGLVLVVGFL